MKKGFYSSSLVSAAESYLIDLFTGQVSMPAFGENEGPSVVVSAAMHIAANSPWGGYPPPQHNFFGHPVSDVSDAPVEDHTDEPEDPPSMTGHVVGFRDFLVEPDGYFRFTGTGNDGTDNEEGEERKG